MTDGRRNIRTTTPTKVPGLPKPPANIDRSLRDYLVACGEALEIRLGRKGDVRDRAITLRELIDSGLAKELRNKPFDPNNTQVDFGDSTTFSETPVTPVSFTVTAGYSVITLKWEGPFHKYQGHSFTEVWRHTANTLADATLIGSSSNIYFIDAVGSGSATYYYWIRHVSTANEPGPWSNNGVGVSEATATDTNTLLSALSTAITSSQLHSDLSTPISNLPTNTNQSFTTVTNTTDALGAQYSVKIQTNSSSGTYISGYGLASETGGNGTTISSFIVAANRFAVIDPATYNVSQANGNTTGNIEDHVPFSVFGAQTIYVNGVSQTVDAGVYIDNGYLNKANISTLLAGSIVGDYIKAAVVMDSPNMHVGTINIGTITKSDANDPRTWTWAKDDTAPNGDRISNFSVDANGVMHATGAVMNGILIKATDGTTLLNSNGILGGSGGNLAFNGNLDRGLVTLADNGTTSTSTSALEGWVATGDSPGTPEFNSTLGWSRVYQVVSGTPTAATVRQNTPRFEVQAGEDLYVYCTTGSTTGMWMAVAYFDNPDGADANTGYSCITAVALSSSTMSTETIGGEGHTVQRQFAVGKVTVPSSGYAGSTNANNDNGKKPRYGELRFGNNSSGPVSDLYFFSVGVSRTPPVIDPLYASTYIRNLSVDTLRIANNAVTVPEGNAGTLNLALSQSDQLVAEITVDYDNKDHTPAGVIAMGAVTVSGDGSTDQGITVEIRRTYPASGNYNGYHTTNSVKASYGEVIPIGGHWAVTQAGTATSFKIQMYIKLGSEGGTRTATKYYLNAIASKK